jgi:hypothetical protein
LYGDDDSPYKPRDSDRSALLTAVSLLSYLSTYLILSLWLYFRIYAVVIPHLRSLRMGDALAAAAAQAGLAPEELRELLDRDAQLALTSPAKRQRADGGSCSGGSGSSGGSDLPPGWVEAKDARYNNKTYWYNKTTRTTSWTRPEWPPQQQPPPRQWCDPTGQRQPQMQAALSPGGSRGQGDTYGPSYGAVAAQPPRAGYTPQRGAGYGGVVPESGPRIETMLDAWVSAKRGKDFATADNIRSELRAVNLANPDPTLALTLTLTLL